MHDARGRACATCHSPDGIELAAYGFDRATIVRRATPHLGEARARRIADYLLEVREAMRTKALDPMLDRPLQPGGRLLPGSSPEQRDAALAAELRRTLPTLFGPPLRTLDDARKALAELRALDLGALPVGIEMDRISEDEFHGAEHALVGDWFADVPPPNAEAARPLEELYLAEPSDANLAGVLTTLDRGFRAQGFGDQIATAKREALLVLTHRLRTGRSYVLPPGGVNPAGRVVESWASWAVFSIDPDVDARKSAFLPLERQGKQNILRWGWLALVLDPSLRGQDADIAWIAARLREERYPTHLALFLTAHASARYLDPKQPPRGMEPRFANDPIWVMASSLKDPGCRAFVANVLRMGSRLDQPARDPSYAERAIAARGL